MYRTGTVLGNRDYNEKKKHDVNFKLENITYLARVSDAYSVTNVNSISWIEYEKLKVWVKR